MVLSNKDTSQRKKDHIDLALQAQINRADDRFFYEPVLNGTQMAPLDISRIGNKTMQAPIWISSMTGGTGEAKHINKNLGKVCGKFGLGMGLGSCRIILDNHDFLPDFQLRKYIGDESPFYANLGIAQIEKISESGRWEKITDLLQKTETDGLIVHINPLQEWLQPEGDKINFPPIQTLQLLIEKLDIQIIVKEVGQGMGPQSLEALFDLPITGIDFGALGGTNFALLEMMRNQPNILESYGDLAHLGHTAKEMVHFCNEILESRKQNDPKTLIVSGGIRTFLDGYYFTSLLQSPAIYGQAWAMLQRANKSLELLENFVENQIKGLQMANNFLIPKPI